MNKWKVFCVSAVMCGASSYAAFTEVSKYDSVAYAQAAVEQDEKEAQQLAEYEFNRCINEARPWNCSSYAQYLAVARDSIQNGQLRFAKHTPAQDGLIMRYLLVALLSGWVALMQLKRKN